MTSPNPTTPTPAVTLTAVTKSYPSGDSQRIQILQNCSWSLPTGTCAAVIGPSGSGKSTLLRLLAGLESPESGSLHVAGCDPSALSPDEGAAFRRDHIGFVFQSHLLLPQLTALENVLLPTLASAEPRNTTADADHARQLLERVGLTKRIHHFPAQLSGGECQRVAVARALVRKPQLLLADEPTGSLDPATAAELADLLFALNADSGMTLILVTHSEKLAARSPEIYRLQGGCLCRL